MNKKITNEWIYLCKYENNNSIIKIILNKLMEPLIAASLNYLKLYEQDIIKYSDLKGICYESIIKAIKLYDVNNKKYNFNQAVFMINRSNLRSHIYPYITNQGEIILSIAYSYDANEKVFRINEIRDNQIKHNSIYYNELIKLINTALMHYSKEDQNIFWELQNGLSYKELCKKHNLKKSILTNRLNSMRYSIRNYLTSVYYK